MPELKRRQFSIGGMTLLVACFSVCLSHWFESRRHRQTRLQLEQTTQELARYRFLQEELSIDDEDVDRIHAISVARENREFSETFTSASWLVHIPENCVGSVSFRLLRQRELGLPPRHELQHLYKLSEGKNRLELGVTRSSDGTWYATGGRYAYEGPQTYPGLSNTMAALTDSDWLGQALAEQNIQVTGSLRQHSWLPDGPKLLYRISAPDDGPEVQFWITCTNVVQSGGTIVEKTSPSNNAMNAEPAKTRFQY